MTLDAETPAEIEETPAETPADETPAETPAEPAEPAPGAKEGEGAPGDEPADETEPKGEEKHGRRGGWQRKAERLDRELSAARELLALRAAQPAPKADPKKTPVDEGMQLIESMVDKRVAAITAQQQQAVVLEGFSKQRAEARVAHPDFDEVLASINDIRVPQIINEALLTSEHGAEIMYSLASSPSELARISALPALGAVREIGRLEAKFASSTAGTKATPKAGTRKPAAPAPIAPVTARGPSTVKRPEDMNFEEYKAWRDGQRSKKR